MGSVTARGPPLLSSIGIMILNVALIEIKTNNGIKMIKCYIPSGVNGISNW